MMKSRNDGEQYLAGPALEESQAVNAACFSPGAGGEGFKDALKKEEVQAFHSGHNPEGEKIGRFRVELKKDIKQVHTVWTLDPSYATWYKGLSDAEQKKFNAEVIAMFREKMTAHTDALVKARTGAGGTTLKDCKVIAISHMHQSTREGNCLLHVHHIMHTHVRCIEDGKTYSGQFRPYFKAQKALDAELNLNAAEITERIFHVKTEIDAITNASKIVGIPPRERGPRYEKAVEYLKEKGIQQTPASMALAMVNTRPPRVKNVDYQQQRERWREEAKQENVRTISITPTVERKESLLKAASDWAKSGIKMLTVAYKITRRNDVDRITLKSAEELSMLMDDTKVRSRRYAHGQAMRAVVRKSVGGLTEALTVAEKAYKKARQPRVRLEKGTIIAVKMEDIAGKYQLRKLKELAAKNGWDLRIKGQRLANEVEVKKAQEQQQERRQGL